MRTTEEPCRELNVKPYQVEYIIRNRLVPEPQKLASGQRVYTDEDVRRIREKLFEISVR
jgi:DNA-binding transcriptional MerR regulator